MNDANEINRRVDKHTANHGMRKRRQSQRVRGVAGAVAASVAAFMLWHWLAPETSPMTRVFAVSTYKSETPAQQAMKQVKDDIDKPLNQSLAPHKLDLHALSPALNFSSTDDFQTAKHWFSGAERSADGKFVTTQTPLRFDASCRGKKEAQHTIFETAIAREVEFDPLQATPADVQVQEIAQFWQAGDTFYKLAGAWERDQPATFRVHLFSATSADFSQQLRVMPLPENLAARTDLLTLGEAMDREADRAVTRGGVRGARFVQVFYPNAKGDASEVKLHNGRPVSWTFGEGRCQMREQGDAYCRCLAETESHIHSETPQPAAPSASKTKETPYRVHD